MRTILFLGLLKISAVCIVLVLAAAFAASGMMEHGMHDRALMAIHIEIMMSVLLVMALVLIVRERRRKQ